MDSQEVNIVIFGDSLIEEGDWNNLLNRNDIKKRGFRGFTTSHYRWILKDSVLNYSPKVCFISGGINDIGAGIPLKRIKTNYKNLINTFIEKKITLVVQSTLYQENNAFSKSMVDSLNTFLIDYCQNNKIEFLDINSRLSSNRGLKKEFSRDGTHLNESAYIIWAEEIKSALKTIEKSQGNPK
ncbi:GDSL-type esterase/lipase family protein [Seonamhaeicola maritimus]|uniref:GDSL-type esterase/lipase family protein n=1 Tax=Seonamhaeicola maritimus TaxID=2591822 RepID=UPI002493DF91|nr:GDSL-type esterase/lipase family protein [Seonamhaeicola maritimus]